MVTTGNGLQAEFTSACEKLQRLFAGALWEAKFNSCSAAWSEVRRTTSAKKKIEILDERVRQWREDSVKAIREWLPKFVDLAQAFPEAVGWDAFRWAKDKGWEVVEGQCGLPRLKEGGLPRVDFINREIVYWFAVASEGNIKVNVPPLRAWTAPHWLARDRKETHSVLTDHAEDLWFRLNGVVEEELNLAEVHRAINRRNPPQQQSMDTVRANKAQGSKKRGRVPRLAREFLDFAGRLWLEVRHSPVSRNQLRQIASELDQKGFIPPADYLEGSYARELKLFNSRNSNSKVGAIKTWTQLVTVGDKDHLRGMRRLLSRCAEKRTLA